MNETFLDKLILKARDGVERRKRAIDLSGIASAAHAVRDHTKKHTFREALSHRDRINVIAEIKRASPSKGVINDHVDIRELARDYERGGAAAISVLTEADYFRGSLDDLRAVGTMIDLPLLRKDFIVDEYQIYEAAEAGADAVLLIVAALGEEGLQRLMPYVSQLGMDLLAEVHTHEELDIAADAGADIIGVNNRDLHSLDVSLDVSRSLIRHRPDNVLMVSESGLSSRSEIDELRALGYDAFLVGETLMRQPQMLAKLAGGDG